MAAQDSYDVVIIGGAMMGAAVAWFLTEQPGFQGRILVIERDPSFSACSTAHTNSCIRQQFSEALNVRISQFAADFMSALPERLGLPDWPRVTIQNYGYLTLADNAEAADQLRASAEIQRGAGAETELLDRDAMAARWPFLRVEDLELGAINLRDEGYWDYMAVFDGWRRSAKQRGVEVHHGEVIALERSGGRVSHVILADGSRIGCGIVVNAAGPRAAQVAGMAGLTLPVEPRKRYTWIFTAPKPLETVLPLIVDPSGMHVRQDGPTSYLAGGHASHDPAVPPDDFTMDHDLWQSEIWPAIAWRIPIFESIRVSQEWAGHYAMNTFDHNAILGPHPELDNFMFINGFSGHGLQQSPAMGRGLAELIATGSYQSLDLSAFHYDRIPENRPFQERAVI